MICLPAVGVRAVALPASRKRAKPGYDLLWVTSDMEPLQPRRFTRSDHDIGRTHLQYLAQEGREFAVCGAIHRRRCDTDAEEGRAARIRDDAVDRRAMSSGNEPNGKHHPISHGNPWFRLDCQDGAAPKPCIPRVHWTAITAPFAGWISSNAREPASSGHKIICTSIESVIR
nr:hypothetical protein [uncultured organism]